MDSGAPLDSSTDTGADANVADTSADAIAEADVTPSLETLPALPLLKNESTTPGLFQATLRAAPIKLPFLGGTTEFWAYNGSVPGPMVVVREGDRVKIRLENGLASQPTIIHWHGLEIPPDQDGLPMSAIAAGKTFDYDFTIPEGTAGTYWYHPHPHMLTAEQAARGLAGVFLILPKGADPLPAYEEKVLMIEDLKLAADGSIADSDAKDRMNGREGNHLVINGAEKPTIAITAGTKQRWRIINACSARFFRFTIPGHKLTLVGTDGGLLGAPVEVDEVFLAPAMRAEIIVTGTGSAGSRVAVKSLSYDRGRMIGNLISLDTDLATLAYRDDAPGTSPAIPTTLRPITALAAGPKVQRIEFAEALVSGEMTFLINGKSWDMARIDWTEQVGVTTEWDVVNTGNMDHPFHAHGGSFQIVSRTIGGVTTPETLLAWRDMANTKSTETVRIRMRLPTTGLRVVHCHILEHENQGMMATFDVKA